MAVPSDPTVSGVVTEALKRGGKVNPSAAEITSATDIRPALAILEADRRLSGLGGVCMEPGKANALEPQTDPSAGFGMTA